MDHERVCKFEADVSHSRYGVRKSGAGDGIRTRNPQLGKLMRYRCATPAQVEERRLIKVLRTVNIRLLLCFLWRHTFKPNSV